MIALSIARFELAQRTRRLSTIVFVLLFVVMGFLTMIAAGGAFEGVTVGIGAGGKVYANASYTLAIAISTIGYLGLLVTAAIFGQSVCQDFETNSQALFFTTPISERSYLAGRYLGALAFATLLYVGIAFGLWIGSFMPFVDRSLFGPSHLAYYAWPYVTSVVPNTIVLGSIFFAIAALSRRMMPVYVAGVVLFMGYLVSGSLMSKIEQRTLAALVDPFGQSAMMVTTEYFSVAEKNTRLVPLSGVLLGNRALWVGLSLALLAYTFARFRFAATAKVPKLAPTEETSVTIAPPAGRLGASSLAHVVRLVALNFGETVRSVAFGVIALAAMLFAFVAASQSGSIYGTPTYPVTYAVLDVFAGTFTLFAIILITIYSGELVWRERDARVDQLLDTMPVRTWVPYVAKLGALVLVQASLLTLLAICGVIFQTSKGYVHYELVLYAKELLGLKLIDFCLLSVLAMTVHVVVQQKQLGHFVMVLYYVLTLFFGKLGIEHNLLKFGGAPGYEYSDMNHYGHLVRPVLWFDLYWALFCVLLAIGGGLLWVRGVAATGRVRLAIARARFTTPLMLATAMTALAFVGVGAFIFYNTNVVNRYESSKEQERERADYEKTYKHIASEPQPRIVGVRIQLDIDPQALSLHATGTYRLLNKTKVPVPVVYVNLPDDVGVNKLAIDGHAPRTIDRTLGVYTIALDPPLAPDATAALDLDLLYATKGFRNGGQPTDVVYNGTFFSSGNLPSLGYVEGTELGDEGSRKKYGLSPKERMRDLYDVAGRANNYISSDADWIDFEAIVSTSPDQLAVAPGYLQREWTENGRRYFDYKMDSKILAFFSVLSARYEVRRDRWNDVALEIDYHAGHEYDLDAMMRGMKAALAYCSTSFGPYQHRQARIIEFPRYQQFAQSFPNTIPYSESIGFIAKVDPKDDKDLDYPFYVTAHEIAHQWWAHQVIGANVQGATMLSETMAQYSALMIMKESFGPRRMKRFLRYELDRYLQGRSFERKKELPLERVENQEYIHYAKGSLVMYALQDYLGEAVVNRVLAEYLAAVKLQEPPYTTTVDLVERFKKATPPALAYLIPDLFETITLYDNRALSATAKEVGGKWLVTMKVKARKVRATELGEEKDVPMNDLVDVGALDEKGDVLFVEKRTLAAGEQDVTFTVDKKPAKVGIDPVNKLIDRDADDNVVAPTFP